MFKRDQPISDSTVTKRGRGRPQGSAPYRERDLKILTKFAEQEVQTPGARLAPLLAKNGYDEPSIRRAQALWR